MTPEEQASWRARFKRAMATALRPTRGGMIHGSFKQWDISEEEYILTASRPCYSCHLLPSPAGSGVGFDRIDNKIGYRLGNVLPCCWDCNRARGERWTIEQMKTLIGPAIRACRELELTQWPRPDVKICQRRNRIKVVVGEE